VDLVEATENFQRATQHCDNLITVHRGYGGPGGGRRAEEVSLNRAVIILTVAAWQAVIQDFATACVDLSAPAPGGPLSRQSYDVLAGRVRQEVGDFATPNAQKSRRLLIGAGFDPRPHWTWRQGAGRGKGWKKWAPADADKRIDEWLRVRHAISHGHLTLPQVEALEAVRTNLAHPPGDPTLRLTDASQCLVFFRRLAKLTAEGLASHLGVPSPY
jgi:hypothetical protein